MSDEMPRLADERLHELREIVACSTKGRGLYLEEYWADDLASVLRELEERRESDRAYQRQVDAALDAQRE